MTTGRIYIIKCTTENKDYIGKTTKTVAGRWNKHLSNFRLGRRESLLYKMMEANGLKNFKIELLEEVPIDIIDEKEAYYIKKYNTLYPNGYNQQTGGVHCKKVLSFREYDKHDEDTRKKISESQLGNRRPGKENRELDHNGDELEKNISLLKKNNKIIGYMVNNFATGIEDPKYFSKKFMSEKFTQDENLLLARLCINELIDKYPQRNYEKDFIYDKYKIDIPKHIYNLIDDNDKQIGYCVKSKSKKIDRKEFSNENMLCDNLKEAILYLNTYSTCKENDDFLNNLKLPSYIAREVVNREVIGFKVNRYPKKNKDGHIQRISRKFCSKKNTLEQNFKHAVDYLDSIKND
jgi:hypothetical protein